MSSMRLKFWGVRGSRPTHKKNLLGFGGNSTSLEFIFSSENFYLFLDGGSGLPRRPLQPNTTIKQYYFLMTHTHWDHILGFPFFKPIYDPLNTFNFFSSNTSKATFNELFFGLQRSVNLPIPSAAIRAKIAIHAVKPAEEFFIENKVKVQTYQLNHQGITLAYRVTYGKDSVAVITDNAPIDHGNYMGEGMREKAAKDPVAFESAFNAGLIDFISGCHTVVFDTHFTEENLKADWGHSTPQRAMRFCLAAGVRRLILFHHAPEDYDQQVEAKIASIHTEAAKQGLDVVAAREGEEWPLHCA